MEPERSLKAPFQRAPIEIKWKRSFSSSFVEVSLQILTNTHDQKKKVRII